MAERTSKLHRWAGALPIATLLAVTAGCGSDDGVSAPPATASTADPRQPSGPPKVSIRDGKVHPSTLRVGSGATVRIRNRDSVSHLLQNRKHHLYVGPIPAKGKSTLTAPPHRGTYVFTDPHHSSMRLKLKVR